MRKTVIKDHSSKNEESGLEGVHERGGDWEVITQDRDETPEQGNQQ